ncbi:MAG: 16S rRNA (guanine(966)-N(2))-methyltransferase RsmD [Solirubrobacterales bacterium]
MRVVAGQFKGRRLSGPTKSATRPTSDKVREALFSILGDITDARVLDLFAGTGALGIEALSRGAAHATFVERDRTAVAVIRENLAATAAEQAAEVSRVIAGDVARYLADARADDVQFDLVLIDPPYELAEQFTAPLAKGLPALLAPDAVVVAECDRRTPLMLESPQSATQNPLALATERRYGDTLLRIFRASQL